MDEIKNENEPTKMDTKTEIDDAKTSPIAYLFRYVLTFLALLIISFGTCINVLDMAREFKSGTGFVTFIGLAYTAFIVFLIKLRNIATKKSIKDAIFLLLIFIIGIPLILLLYYIDYVFSH